MDRHSTAHKTRSNEGTMPSRTAEVATAAVKATRTCFLTVGDSGDAKMDTVVSTDEEL
jgi:hypothetical protein